MKHLLLFFAVMTYSMSTSAQGFAQEIDQYREKYKQDFTHYNNSPLDKDDLESLQFYAADKKYRLTCAVAFNANSKDVVTISTYTGKTKQYLKYARLSCPLGKDTIDLIAYKSVRQLRHPIYSKLLFIPFKDYTNGEETYGGGRYIDLALEDIQESKVILDFNTAYNPWCAYADGYNCPIPPIENHIKLKILAGEKIFIGR